MHIIQTHNLNHVAHTDPNNNLACLTWASRQQLDLLATHGEVVMLDATYKVNNIRMPLFSMAVVDRDGHGQPVAHALLAREDEEHIKMFIGDVTQWQPQIATSTFITDKDFAEINAVKNMFPDVKVFLCHFHVMKAFVEEINKQSPPEGETLLGVGITVSMLWCSIYL